VLARDMEEKFRDIPVYIGTIDDVINPRENEIPSPETEN